MRRILALSFVAPLFFVSACGIYFGGDDDDDWDDCPPYGAADPGSPLELRNPYTGDCEYWGGGDWCDPQCGPCAGSGGGAQAPIPTWGFCQSFCTGLDEASCLINPGCQAGYIETASPDPDPNIPPTQTFWECWQTDLSGPQQTDDCAAVSDAQQCSTYDNCIAIHDDTCDGSDSNGLGIACGLGEFQACEPEPVGCYSDGDCGNDLSCNADELCLPPPGCEDTNEDGLIDCDAACYGYCVEDDSPPECSTLDENTCVVRVDCTPFYEGFDCDCDANGDCVCAEWVFDSCMNADAAP
jgi:hypothetical protein